MSLDAERPCFLTAANVAVDEDGILEAKALADGDPRAQTIARSGLELLRGPCLYWAGRLETAVANDLCTNLPGLGKACWDLMVF